MNIVRITSIFLIATLLFAVPASAGELTHLTPWQANALLEDGSKPVILDVRRPDEFQSGHIRDAQNLDFYERDFQSHIDGLDKEKTYLVYCRTGRRSGITVDYMIQAGFKNILHIKDGIRSWVGAGLPVVR